MVVVVLVVVVVIIVVSFLEIASYNGELGWVKKPYYFRGSGQNHDWFGWVFKNGPISVSGLQLSNCLSLCCVSDTIH